MAKLQLSLPCNHSNFASSDMYSQEDYSMEGNFTLVTNNEDRRRWKQGKQY